MLEKVAYVLALMLWITLPVAILYWFLIHPFAAFWRRLGPSRTYLLVAVPAIALGFLMYRMRAPLETHWGFHWPLVVIGVILYAIAGWIEVSCRRHLKFRILAGVPELSEDDPGNLLTEGIYAHIRNPRYLDIIIGLLGISVILNYPALYVLYGLSVIGLVIVALLEERELEERFGDEFRRYKAAVPRFLPTTRRRAS